jgi:hypothetical protein
MTNDEKVAWLDQCNRHLAAGGKLECCWDGEWVAARPAVPSWTSEPKNWRIVPLPRKARIHVAYRWNSDGKFEYTIAQSGIKYGGDFKMAEIEVSDES